MKRLSILLVCMMTLCSTALAATPYKTFTRTKDGNMTQTQTAYEPLRTMIKFGDESLKSPSDMRLGPDGNLYIADSGNKRILVVTTKGDFVREIGSSKTLKSPRGVFVNRNGDVYVADENSRAVIVFNKDGEVIAEYGKPTHPLFGEQAPYKPNKVVVDRRGNLYVISTGNTNGIVQISPGTKDGEFLGYFGANRSIVSLLTMLRKELFNEAQLARTGNVIPPSLVNLSIDQKGMIYTVTQTSDMNTLRKLNVAGKNILRPDWYAYYPSAVTTNPAGNIYMTDANGYIYEYTSEGKLLFIFGSYDDGQQRKGLFKSVTGIAVDHNNLVYVLDEQTGAIQVFVPTEFCRTVHRAFELFMDGKYVESKEPWGEVLRMNSLFTYANIGLGEALYREGDYENTLTAFRNGGHHTGYSDAFWELRSNWLHANIGTFLIALFIGAMVLVIISKINKRTHFLAPAGRTLAAIGGLKPFSQVGYGFMALKNPFDFSYGIKRENKASIWSALFMLLAFFALTVLNKYYSGFLFKTVPDGDFNLLSDFLTVFGVFFLLVICCYLVCTISEGEATFKSLFIGMAYSLLPLILALPVLFVFSHVLSYNEAVFISLLKFLAYAWTAVLIFLNLMYLNDYSIKKTVWTLVLTAFTALIAVALLFVVYVLVSQFVDFLSSVFGEVVYRFVKA